MVAKRLSATALSQHSPDIPPTARGAGAGEGGGRRVRGAVDRGQPRRSRGETAMLGMLAPFVSVACGAAGDSGEQVGVVGELGAVFERESFRTFAGAGDDERGDVDQLTVPSGRRLRVAAGGVEVVPSSGFVAADAGKDCEQGVVDRVHAVSVSRRAYSALTCHVTK